MKKTIITSLLFGLMSFNVFGQAFEARKPVLCDNVQTLIKSLLENYNEKPLWTARNPQDNTRYMLFVNDKSGAWTLLQMTPEIACIVGVGEDSQLMLRESV